ncbi:MAG: hypothetical protein HKN19_13060, partial [Halioglobus sp.]|nr:hypothetical protein [Halioglobus sp.]
RQHQAHWIEKRLLANFGQQGLNTLGGSEALKERLARAENDPLSQYRELCAQLAQSHDDAR